MGIPPLYEPHTPLHGYTLPPGAFRLGVTLTKGHNPTDFGSDDFYSLFFDQVEVNFVNLNLDLFYGFEALGLNDLTLRINVPFKSQRTSGTGHPFRIDPMIMTMEASGSGLGDVSATIKKKWFDQGNSFMNLATMLGVIFPTAEDNQLFNASQTVTMTTPMGTMMMPVNGTRMGDPAIDVFGRTPGDLLQPRSAQPGNGSWGLRVGFGATHQFARSAFHVGAIYDLLADNDGITPGNELRYAASLVIPPFSSDHFTLDLTVKGFRKGNESFPGTIMHPERDPATGMPMMDATGAMQMFVTPRPSFNHGNIIFASPSLIFVPSPNVRLYANPSIRIREPEQGPSPAWTVTVGQSVTF